MATTSNTTDWANELVTPFFTRTQVYAFTLPPSKDVIEKVNKGGQQDYIPHEYIRALLDRYIGAGRWEMRAELHSTDKEIITKHDFKAKKDVQNVAATANVNVTLVIHAQDGSDKTLEFSAVGSNTQYAGIEKGFGSIIGNAISSAESLGLKRAATNLGRAFGFDLKSKVKKEELPPSIPQLAAQLNQRHAAANDRPALAAPALTAVATAEPAKPAVAEVVPSPVAHTAEAEAPADTAEARQETAPQPTEAAEISQTPASEKKIEAAQQTEPATEAQPKAAESAQTSPAPVASSNPASGASAAPADTSGQPKATAVPSDEDWELSLIPTKFEEWLKCIQTMARRVTAMTSERELLNFIRRNKKLIDKLPIIAGTEGKPEKNFKKRWTTIINKRCGELQIEVPAEYKILEPA